MKIFKLFFILVTLTMLSIHAKGQGGYEDLLFEEVTNENPVYMPVLGFGPGVITYYGELNNDTKNLIQGTPSFRFNVYQFLDQKHYFKVNFFLILGKLTGQERSYSDVTRNLNFQTDITDIGVNLEYGFGHLYSSQKKLRPFISLGGGYFFFNSKADLILNSTGEAYNYQPDGTIRDNMGRVIERDYIYETDLRDLDLFGRGSYNQNSLAAALDAGFDLHVADRVFLRLGTSLHYTFTDDMDNISYENTTGRIGDDLNDMFSMTYFTLHIDFFSEDETIITEKLFMDVSGDFDYTLIADDDRDGVLNLGDDCPNTPRGVAVDTVGCPLDDDLDGVPNYKDQEYDTPDGMYVDENGVQMQPTQVLNTLNFDLQAVDREEAYMMPITSRYDTYNMGTVNEIPDKFKKLDLDGDRYISFDELLKAIDAFFDFDSDFTSQDIYELNSFFFAQ